MGTSLSSSFASGDISKPSLWLPSFLALILVYIIYQRFFHPLASIPGPFAASLSRAWLMKHSWDGDMSTTMIALHKQHGDLVRTGPNELSVADLAAIKTIYGAGTRFRKSDWYSVWQGRRRFDLFAERDERVHAAQRRLVSRAYSAESLRDLEPYVDESIRVLLGHMEQRAGQVVDFGKWVQLFAFGKGSRRCVIVPFARGPLIMTTDVIGEVTFSKRFGFMDAGTDSGTFYQLQGALRSASWLGQMPAIYWIHDLLMPYIGNHLKINARHGSLRQFAANEVAARRERGSDRNDILSKLLETHKLRPDEFDQAALTSMATSNIFAGSDTTAISIRAVVYYLLKNSSCARRLAEEIDEFHSQDKLSDPVSLSEAASMPYLQAVINEALRLHPAAGMNLPRVTPTGGVQIAGKYVPAGTVVGVHPWVVQRNARIFGEDPDHFKPERWLKADTGDMHRFMFAFGSGSRMCLGKNISMMEM